MKYVRSIVSNNEMTCCDVLNGNKQWLSQNVLRGPGGVCAIHALKTLLLLYYLNKAHKTP